jgi:chemotaxis signal transduction protein
MAIPTSRSPTWRSEHPHYVTLTFGDTILALPQGEVHTLESMLDLQPDRQGWRIGWIALRGQHWPVYCPAASLEPLASSPDARRICVMLSAADGLFGLACEAVSTVDAERLETVSLPACMSTPEHPVSALARSGDDLLCITCAADLLSFASRALRAEGGYSARPSAPLRDAT